MPTVEAGRPRRLRWSTLERLAVCERKRLVRFSEPGFYRLQTAFCCQSCWDSAAVCVSPVLHLCGHRTNYTQASALNAWLDCGSLRSRQFVEFTILRSRRHRRGCQCRRYRSSRRRVAAITEVPTTFAASICHRCGPCLVRNSEREVSDAVTCGSHKLFRRYCRTPKWL